ncbi:MAG: hypothetical protein AAB091_04495 [Elusimicrobiota bacterium]
MQSKRNFWLGLSAAFIAGLAVGALGGSYGSFRLAKSYFGSNWLYEQAKDVESKVAFLKTLRSDGQQETIEGLEVELDDDLISMQPDKFITKRTMAEIDTAVQMAKEYRLIHPRKSGRPMIDRMIVNLFANGYPEK